MRSDKEQLDLIMQKKATAERKRGRNRRILYSTLALVICLSVTLSYVFITGKQKNRKESVTGDFFNGEWFENIDNTNGVIGGGDKAESPETDTKYPGDKAESPETDTKYYYSLVYGDAILEDVTDSFLPGRDDADTNVKPSAGILTGGELRDNADYKVWLETAKKEGWNSLGSKWQLSTAKRITVKTEGCAGAIVELLDADGKVLYGAVTNADGVAYLFVNEQDRIKTVAVRVGEKSATQAYGGTEYSFDMENQGVSKKLDLMFVVDTTGSMGDELEYLKAEIADVIDRIASKDIAVRTSVNFYRDEGDDYVVKYYGFNTDAKAVQEIVQEQRSDGGGDYEEAVHTALHNAVYEHAWEKDSVKVMFLVLDAPPHDNEEVIASLSETVKQAAAMGIRIVPVASSGIEKSTEGLLRSIALITGGSYTFLTDHSGIGNSHLPPSTEQYEVEALNDMLVRITLEHCGVKTDKNLYNKPYTEDNGETPENQQ